ncbi:class E sortase [Streptomyces sp. HB132]|uniref:class E sortase n=1 Tax=Streptomyces sp. HB132 TaxID=767388 RepID=UPI00195F8B03|nr:class E sortase [Streptomyces sp. HB132]MBM7437776.1 sortase A [Streptomyces sp. HB132]
MHRPHVLRDVPRALAGVAVVLLAAGGPAVAAATGPPPVAAAAVAAPAGRSTGPPSDRTAPRTETAELTIPSIGVTDLRVVPYEGTTDDGPGTRIQDRGVAASPYGEHGGVGPGEIGNYLVTAHRLSAGGPLRELPALEKGDAVLVTEGGTVYEYRITENRQTSFRSERSLAEQRAEVPGEPGEEPTRAMITLSSCATPEDDAAGNLWRDAHHNPEHRIDRVGVLVSSRPA